MHFRSIFFSAGPVYPVYFSNGQFYSPKPLHLKYLCFAAVPAEGSAAEGPVFFVPEKEYPGPSFAAATRTTGELPRDTDGAGRLTNRNRSGQRPPALRFPWGALKFSLRTENALVCRSCCALSRRKGQGNFRVPFFRSVKIIFSFAGKAVDINIIFLYTES